MPIRLSEITNKARRLSDVESEGRTPASPFSLPDEQAKVARPSKIQGINQTTGLGIDTTSQLYLDTDRELSTLEIATGRGPVWKVDQAERDAIVNDAANAVSESPENLYIGTLRMGAGLLNAFKAQGMMLTGGGLVGDDAVRHLWEVVQAPTPQEGGESGGEIKIAKKSPLDELFPNRPKLPGAIAGEALGVGTRSFDALAKMTNYRAQKIAETQAKVTIRNAPITALTRLVVQGGVPSVGASLAAAVLTGDPMIGIVLLAETSGGQAFQEQLEGGGSVRKSLLIGQFAAAAEAGGELLVFPKFVKGLTQGILLSNALLLIAENAGQEGLTGFNQEFMRVFGLETSKGMSIADAAKVALDAGWNAIPENAFVGGLTAAGVSAASLPATIYNVAKQEAADATTQEAATETSPTAGESPTPSVEARQETVEPVATPTAEEVIPTGADSRQLVPTQTEDLTVQKQPWEMSDLATSPNIPEDRVQAKKREDGKWQLFYRGTRNEVFQGELFSSATEAKQFFAVQKIKAQEALSKIGATNTGPTGQTSVQGAGVAPGMSSPEATPAQPDVMNFTQFANSKGYPSDFDVLDDGVLSPSGKMSGKSREFLNNQMAERFKANLKAHEEYQAAIDRGEIVDPEGKYTPTPPNKTQEAKKAQSRIAQLESIIQTWEQVGISGKTGKLRPTFAKQIADAQAEIERLRPIAEGIQATQKPPEAPKPSPTQSPAPGEIVPQRPAIESQQADTGTVETPPGKRVSRAAQRVNEEAIAKDLTESLGELPTYEKMSMADQARMAADEISNDYENAKRMAYGLETPPAGLRPASIYRAVAVKARNEGDVETLRNLAVVHPQISQELTAMGQAIKAADVGILADPVKAIQAVQKAKEAAAKKKGKAKDVKAEKTKWAKGAKEAIKTKTHHRQSWDAFVKAIQC